MRYSKEITQERLKELLHYDPETGVFTRRVSTENGRWKEGTRSGAYNPKLNRWAVRIDHKNYWASRLAWLYMTGDWPLEFIDHRDGNSANDIFANLREAAAWGNLQNRRKANSGSTSKLLGVSYVNRRKAWIAQICVGRKNRYLGQFATEAEAHVAYVKAKRELHPFGEL